MKKTNLFFAFCMLIIQLSFAQEFKTDSRTPLEKEDPMSEYNTQNTTMLDFLKTIEIQGIKINNFKLGKFNKNYNIMLMSDKYEQGQLIKTDTLLLFENTYRYQESGKIYTDFLSSIKTITKKEKTKSELHIMTYSFSSKVEIELKRTNENSFFNWRTYSNTNWKLNKKIPLMIYASSWEDKKYGVERFCGVRYLTDNGEYTNDLLNSSPSYVIIYYSVIEK